VYKVEMLTQLLQKHRHAPDRRTKNGHRKCLNPLPTMGGGLLMEQSARHSTLLCLYQNHQDISLFSGTFSGR